MSAPRSAVPILMYHEVAGPADTASRLAVPPDAFAEQLSHLQAEQFTVITMSTLAVAMTGDYPLPARPVVLTFDDGFADFHEVAVPLLREHGFTATVFVTTGWIQDAGPSGRARPGRMLTWQQLLEAAAAGMEIGAHSHTHPQLDQLPGGQLARELADSKSALEDRLGAPVPGFAYPFGYSSARVRHAVLAAGYGYACVVGNAMASTEPEDLFAVPRLTIRRSTRLSTFGQIIHGRQVPMIFARDRALTRGWAMVRRSRAVFGGASRAG